MKHLIQRLLCKLFGHRLKYFYAWMVFCKCWLINKFIWEKNRHVYVDTIWSKESLQLEEKMKDVKFTQDCFVVTIWKIWDTPHKFHIPKNGWMWSMEYDWFVVNIKDLSANYL